MQLHPIPPIMLRYVTLWGGVEFEPMVVTYSMSWATGGRGKKPEWLLLYLCG